MCFEQEESVSNYVPIYTCTRYFLQLILNENVSELSSKTPGRLFNS